MAFGPGHFRASAVMRKVPKPQAETVAIGAAIKTHHVAKIAELFRVAISGEPHDFVLVAKFQEAEILRHRGVKQPQRMRKSYRPVDPHAVVGAGAPHGARDIAEAVGGKQRGPFKGCSEEPARDMHRVVFGEVKGGTSL